MKISEGKIGKTYIVKGIELGLEVKRRFEILGMTVNSAVEIVNSKRSGTKIIKVRGTRFAIGRKFAEGIEVVDKSCDEKEGEIKIEEGVL